MKSILAILSISLLMISCKKEGCTDTTALNYNAEADVDDGTCVYPEPDPREPYLGNYWVTDSTWIFGSFSEENVYTLQVTTGGTASDTIYLNNLWNDGVAYFAIMAGTNFSIPSQQVSGPYYAEGSGNFTNDVITYQTSGDAYVNHGIGPKQ
ncbi:hypothetical protein K6119_00380 [Paracrocinitomix mangrovi]|uniref:hypothetical protein n=1 Tax=Paracrocinitomix mangrovi TaxID=2862509 RepID=UPI001C8EB892|nr:hypothetical protein [Paracrocinitomix mangrovi]UKN01970.1 hypothetical protein K6119_00380 [Paracrocinitomix mangrovi]